MSEAIKQIVSEFEKPVIEIPSDIMDAIQCSRLDLSQNIPDPQMLVSKGNLPVCTRGNFSFVIGLPGARKSFFHCVILSKGNRVDKTIYNYESDIKK